MVVTQPPRITSLISQQSKHSRQLNPKKEPHIYTKTTAFGHPPPKPEFDWNRKEGGITSLQRHSENKKTHFH